MRTKCFERCNEDGPGFSLRHGAVVGGIEWDEKPRRLW